MKKFFLCLAFAFPLIMSCNDKDDKKTEEEEEEEAVDALFFSVQNGTFQSGDLPTGNDSFLSNFQMNDYVITGGASIITFSSSERLSDVYVGIKGLKGYYACPLKTGITYATDNTYVYEITLLMSQNLKNEKFAVSLSAVSSDGKKNVALHSDEIGVIAVASGKLQISVTWDQLDDVDLYLVEPSENVICWASPFSSDEPLIELYRFAYYLVQKYTNHYIPGFNPYNEDHSALLLDYLDDVPESVNIEIEKKTYLNNNQDRIKGFLDLDSNSDCEIDGVNNENITYATQAPNGMYYVAIDLYAKCANYSAGARYAVTINYDGQPITIAPNQNGKFSDTNKGSYGEVEKLVVIGAFRIMNGKIETQSTMPERLNTLSVRNEARLKSFSMLNKNRILF